MTLPSLALALVISLLMGTAFHLIVDGGPGRLILYMILSMIGFAGGQWLAMYQSWILLPVGPVQLGPAMVGSLLFLVVGRWLSSVRVEAVDHTDTV